MEVTDISEEDPDEREEEFQHFPHHHAKVPEHPHRFANGTAAANPDEDLDEDVFKAPAPPPPNLTPFYNSQQAPTGAHRGLLTFKSEPVEGDSTTPPPHTGSAAAPPTKCIPLKLRFKRRWSEDQRMEASMEESDDKKVRPEEERERERQSNGQMDVEDEDRAGGGRRQSPPAGVRGFAGGAVEGEHGAPSRHRAAVSGEQRLLMSPHTTAALEAARQDGNGISGSPGPPR